jgi:hypothetical protein
MAVTLTLVGKTPGQTQFGPDTFTEHYKCDATADVVLTDSSVPQKGDAHPDYAFMFLTDRHCQETGEKASALDLIYMGCLKSSGGLPVLPPAQIKYSSVIQTGSSSVATDGTVAATPLNMQFYAQTSEYSFITYNALGVTGTGPDPPLDPIVVWIQIQNNFWSPGSPTIDAFIDAYFQILITDTITNQELVLGGKFYLNTEVKTKYYGPPIVDMP